MPLRARRSGPESFEVRYLQAGGPADSARYFNLQGNQWSVSGGVIKWHPWLAFLGLRSYHKPLRITGQYSDLKKQQSRPPTAFALEPGADWLWEAAYRASDILPFVDAVYGSSAYAYLDPAEKQQVYVNHSGYLIRREKR